MTGSTMSVTLDEIQVIRLVLQFLSSRELHKSARNLERETGITNCLFTDDVLFLRQLILDGEWDATLTYAQPLEKLEGFDSKAFRYIIYREKFMEILYFKSGVEGVSSNYSIDDMIKCLSHLETNCPVKSDYTKLCWLLTVPELYSLPEYQGWNPETARIKCFNEAIELVKKVMPIERKKGSEKSQPSVSNNRLVNLIIKGLCFENCVDYCHQRAVSGNIDDDNINLKNNILWGSSQDSTGNFLSWLHSLPQESFVSPFEALSLKVDFKKSSQRKTTALSNKRLQNEKENLSKSLQVSERPSTASKVDVIVPEPLTTAKKVSNSYSNFHCTKPTIDFKPIDADKGIGTPRRDSLNEEDIKNNEKQGNIQAGSTEPSIEHKSLGISKPISSERLDTINNETNASQDSLDKIKRNQENNVLKQLENHEKQREELRRQLLIGTNTQAEVDDWPKALTEPITSDSSDGHRAPLEEDDPEAGLPVNSNAQAAPVSRVAQRESPIGKEVSPCFKDNTDIKQPLQVSSTPLGKKKLVPGPLKIDNVSISRIDGPSINETKQLDDSHGNHGDNNEEKTPKNHKYPITPVEKILPPGSLISLADGSGVLNTSTPKSTRGQMSNTAGPLVSPVGLVSHQPGATTEQQPDQDKVSTVASSNEAPTPRRGPKINGVRRSLVSSGPPMPRNKGPGVANVEPQETGRTPLKEKTSKAGHTPRDRTPVGQRNPSRKISKEETKPKAAGHTFVVDNGGPVNETKVKSTTKSNAVTEKNQQQWTKLLEKQQGYMKNNPDRITFNTVASLEDIQAIRAVAFHPSGELFAVGSNSKILRICAATGLNNYKKLDSNDESVPPQPTILFKRNRHHKGSIYCAAWSPTGDMLATGSNDKTIKILHFDSDDCTQTGPEMELNIHGGTVRDLAFASRSGGSPLLVSGGAGCGNIQITDTTTGSSMGQLKGHSDHIMSIYAAKDDIIATGSNDNTVRLWDLRSQRCIDAIATGESCVASVCVSPAGTLLSSGHEDGGCMIYDITAGRTLQFFKPHTLDCRSVRFSSDGHYLLTASYDTSIILLDMQYNLECNIPPYSVVAQHRDKVIQCRWHPKLMAFVSSSADKTASLWTLDC